MRFRTLIAAASVVAVTAVAAPASADDGIDVGGGAAGIVATTLASSPTAKSLTGYRYIGYTLSTPRVEMGPMGGSAVRDATSIPADLSDGAISVSSALPRAVSLPVQAQIARVSVFGNRVGTPYAEAQVDAAHIRIPSRGFELRGVTAHCRWDLAGARGYVTEQTAAGSVVPIAANTRHDFPGLGTLVLNEQYRESVWLNAADGSQREMEVVYVIAAHLYLEAAAADLYDVTDVKIGVTSCDPLKVPPLSGVTLVSGGSSSGR